MEIKGGRIVKFNGGDPVVLCSGCRKILHRAHRQEDHGDPAEYCNKCKDKTKR